jgi:phospholipase/lecithinase/hemolysin
MHSIKHPNRARTLFVALALFVSLVPAISARTAFSKVVTFGDSLSDNGNLYAMTGGAVPPAPYYWNGRFSNGPVWPEYVADRLGLADKHLNFAVGGASTSQVLAQVGQYAASLGGGPADSDALYLVNGGANDLLGIAPDADPVPVLVGAITNLGTAIGWLQAMGAKHIVVMNFPNLGLAPRGRAMPDGGAGATVLSTVFNNELENVLVALEWGWDGKIIRGDAYAFVTSRVTDPSTYGFLNVTVPVLWGGSADGAFFWDDIHPTTMAHSQFADEVLAAALAAHSPRQGKGNGPGTINGMRGLAKAK